MFFKKTPVLESLFNKVAGLLFPVKFAKILRTPPVAILYQSGILFKMETNFFLKLQFDTCLGLI